MDNFQRYFKSVNCPNSRFYNADDDVLYFIERYEQNEFDIMFNELNMPFSSDDVKKAIQQLQNNKSCGPDLYINEIFIHGKDVFIPYLFLFLTRILILDISQNLGLKDILYRYIKREI